VLANEPPHALKRPAVTDTDPSRRDDLAPFAPKRIEPFCPRGAVRPLRRRTQRCYQFLRITRYGEVGSEMRPDGRRISMHMSKPHLWPHQVRISKALRGDVGQTGAEHQQ